MTEHEALLCLNAVSGLGSYRIKRLIKAFGSGVGVWRQGYRDLCRAEGIGPQLANGILNFDRASFLKSENRLIHDHQVKLIVFFDEIYPEYLKAIDDYPIVLYTLGKWEHIRFPGVAIVGSRRSSVYGQLIARKFGRQLGDAGVTVISGMARGIDTEAHHGCLESRGNTVAVLGSGLAHIYPRENTKLFSDIGKSGCVISECPMTTKPMAGNFPRRNRIISGLSAGVVVVEAAQRSGALITSRCALDQGREVFAVPGKIGSAQARGVNRLIQQGAKLVTCVEDILEELSCFAQLETQQKNMDDSTLTSCCESEHKLLNVLSDEPIYIDDIAARAQLEHKILMQTLLKFECCGRIKRLPGNYFYKIK